MTIDVQTYLDQLSRKKGKLAKWEDEIFQLHNANVSYAKIADFLKLNGTEATKAEVYQFIHRKKRQHLMTALPLNEGSEAARKA